MSFFRSTPVTTALRTGQLAAAAAGRQPAAARRSMSLLDKAKQALSSDHPLPAEPSTTDHLTAQATSSAPSEAGLARGENNTSTRGTAAEETGGRLSAGEGIKVEERLAGKDVLAEGAKDKPSKQQ